MTKGTMDRFAIASARKALRIVGLLVLGSELIPGITVGDLVLDMMTIWIIGIDKEGKWLPGSMWKLSYVDVMKCGRSH